MAKTYGFSSLVRNFLDVIGVGSLIAFNSNKKGSNEDDTDIYKMAEEVKKEINRTLQIANRRAENIENSELASPAYKALANELSPSLLGRFTKFTIAGLDLLNPMGRIKIVDIYSRALAFINNQTSSVRGARKFIEKIAWDNNIPFDVANNLIDLITSPQITNGTLVINNWDSDRIANMISEYAEEYDATRFSPSEFLSSIEQKISNALEGSGFNGIDIWDL